MSPGLTAAAACSSAAGDELQLLIDRSELGALVGGDASGDTNGDTRALSATSTVTSSTRKEDCEDDGELQAELAPVHTTLAAEPYPPPCTR